MHDWAVDRVEESRRSCTDMRRSQRRLQRVAHAVVLICCLLLAADARAAAPPPPPSLEQLEAILDRAVTMMGAFIGDGVPFTPGFSDNLLLLQQVPSPAPPPPPPSPSLHWHTPCT